jgi:hypothetical protein
MLSKCANPGCCATFLYLSRGKLFRWETSGAARSDAGTFGADPKVQKTNRRLKFFWLCDDCAPAMTLINEKGIGVVARPLLRAKAAAAGAVAATSRVSARSVE